VHKTAAIIVTYNPILQYFKTTLNSIINQISLCVIIDNGNTKFESIYHENAIVINLGKNYGIAYAQNRGIEIARQHKVDFILLSDQDTIYPDNYVGKLLSFYEVYSNKNDIGALVPRFYDKNKMSKTRVAIGKFTYIVPEDGKIYKVAHAVSSGTFIPVNSLEKIGVMLEKLFIDWVDFEWCCRTTNMGYEIISVPQVSIEHMMGDTTRKVGNKTIALRSRVRYYYMIRNGIYLMGCKGILKTAEKFCFGIDLLGKAIGIFLIEKNPLPLLVKAIHDGITGRMYEIRWNRK